MRPHAERGNESGNRLLNLKRLIVKCVPTQSVETREYLFKAPSYNNRGFESSYFGFKL
ncbi:hypothetical protein NIES3974_26880 [Calothrix sp. NIES-3974]|nr:hypothetical protein NIES3974_26880 [Calothrix sp. NIES-3974]